MVSSYDYRLYSAQELSTLQEKLASLFKHWLTAWALHQPEAVTLTLTPHAEACGDWLVDETGKLVAFKTAGLTAFFSKLCFNHKWQNPTALAMAILAQAQQAMWQDLLLDHGPQGKADQLPAAFGPKGRVLLVLSVGNEAIELMLSVAKAVALLGAVPVAEADLMPLRLSQLPLIGQVPLCVGFQPTAMPLGELSSMRVGDVLTLDHVVTDPLVIRDSHGQTIGLAEMGKMAGSDHLAVRLQAEQSINQEQGPSL